MVGAFFWGFCLVPIIIAQSNMPAGLKSILRKPSNEKNFWNMPVNHPIRKELERDPGVLLGKVEDFNIDQLRQGDFSTLRKGIMQTNSKNPFDMFLRRQRTSGVPQCTIEIQMIVSRPGNCIRLRDNTPACQNEEYVAIDHEECK